MTEMAIFFTRYVADVLLTTWSYCTITNHILLYTVYKSVHIYLCRATIHISYGTFSLSGYLKSILGCAVGVPNISTDLIAFWAFSKNLKNLFKVTILFVQMITDVLFTMQDEISKHHSSSYVQYSVSHSFHTKSLITFERITTYIQYSTQVAGFHH